LLYLLNGIINNNCIKPRSDTLRVLERGYPLSVPIFFVFPMGFQPIELNKVYYIQNINDNCLEGQEAIHCLKVLRKQAGDIIKLTDGQGYFYSAEITTTSNKKAGFKIIETQKIAYTQPKLHLYFAPTKQAIRNEWMLEKCTEIGIYSFTPIICENSERRKINLNRLNKIIISAIKQSQRAWLPNLNDITSFKTTINKLTNVEKYLASYNIDQKDLNNVLVKSKDVAIFIGPEGDFSEKEKQLAQKNSFTIVNLGSNRLRTETACIAATHLFNILNRT